MSFIARLGIDMIAQPTLVVQTHEVSYDASEH